VLLAGASLPKREFSSTHSKARPPVGLPFRRDGVSATHKGHYSALLSHLANVSGRVGNKKLAFDAKTETFVGAPEANQYVKRRDRAPWVIPEKV